ncbi:Gfo/Idh/MocA family oxidoreductase, partial [Microbacteriaceae bacterium K1510]|nr:Gfo/Idh/MocA family oxidoreductase [Microbacteriaceae bacterium K1510]
MTKQTPIRVGIIGLGGMGERLMQAFLLHPDVQVSAVCDTAASRAKEVAEKTNVAAWYTDYHQLLQDESIQLVYVAVPPKFHHAIVLDAIAARKHILCEKPLANSLQEAEEMLAAAEKAGVLHAMNFPTYYRSVFAELAKRVSEGYLGELRRVEIVTHFHKWPREWQQTPWIAGREQGGFVREVFPHFIHLTQQLFGPISEVKSELEYPADPNACETGIIASMKLENGTPILINGVSNIGMKEHLSFTLYGTQGTLAVVNWGELHAGKYGEPLVEMSLPEHDRLSGLVDNVVKALQGEEANLIDFKVGYEVQRVLEALLQ